MTFQQERDRTNKENVAAWTAEFDKLVADVVAAIRSSGHECDSPKEGRITIDGRDTYFGMRLIRKGDAWHRKAIGYRVATRALGKHEYYTKSWPRPKAGYDAKKLADYLIAVVEGQKADDGAKAARRSAELANAKTLGRVLEKNRIEVAGERYAIGSDEKGVGIEFDGLGEEQANALIAAAMKAGVILKLS